MNKKINYVKVVEIKQKQMNNEERLEEEACEHKMKAFGTGVEYLSIPDIRNKLSPITNIICLLENGDIEYLSKKDLTEVKKSINYLSNREVYKI